ncbi:MAG TPA: hypothetical protein VGU00_10960 [Sphingopyxis sp.]|nr:hypothetical protein [Sphingopyxis sp.]
MRRDPAQLPDQIEEERDNAAASTEKARELHFGIVQKWRVYGNENLRQMLLNVPLRRIGGQAGEEPSAVRRLT